VSSSSWTCRTNITTNVCAESTARDAFMRDYDVVLVEDGAGAPTKAEHEAAVHNIRSYFGRALDASTIEEHWAARPPSWAFPAPVPAACPPPRAALLDR
jgi:isochorismate hydrolase